METWNLGHLSLKSIGSGFIAYILDQNGNILKAEEFKIWPQSYEIFAFMQSVKIYC